MHQRNIEQHRWMSPLVECQYGCQALSWHRSTIQKGLRNNQLTAETRVLKASRQEPEGKRLQIEWVLPARHVLHTHRLPSGEMRKNTLLLRCIHISWSECRELFSCALKLKDARACFCKAPSRGHLYLLHKLDELVHLLGSASSKQHKHEHAVLFYFYRLIYCCNNSNTNVWNTKYSTDKTHSYKKQNGEIVHLVFVFSADCD